VQTGAAFDLRPTCVQKTRYTRVHPQAPTGGTACYCTTVYPSADWCPLGVGVSKTGGCRFDSCRACIGSNDLAAPLASTIPPWVSNLCPNASRSRSLACLERFSLPQMPRGLHRDGIAGSLAELLWAQAQGASRADLPSVERRTFEGLKDCPGKPLPFRKHPPYRLFCSSTIC